MAATDDIRRYTDADTIGVGGFGRVIRCHCDGRTYAKKILVDESNEMIRRFQREVRALQALQHPHIVPVIATHLSSPPYCYVMPFYLHTLASRVSTLRLDLRRVATVFHRIILAVEHAHSKSLIHRDLKPQNVLLSADEVPVVADFGLVRDVNSESTDITTSGHHLGTYLYMAPEQFNAMKHVDGRGDIYSIGRMIIHMYGGLMASGAQEIEVVPEPLRTIASRCVKMAPNDRYSTVSALRAVLENAFKHLENVLPVPQAQPSPQPQLQPPRRTGDSDTLLGGLEPPQRELQPKPKPQPQLQPKPQLQPQPKPPTQPKYDVLVKLIAEGHHFLEDAPESWESACLPLLLSEEISVQRPTPMLRPKRQSIALPCPQCDGRGFNFAGMGFHVSCGKCDGNGKVRSAP